MYMYIYLCVILISYYIVKMIEIITESTVFWALQIFLYSGQFAFLLIYFIKGMILSQKREKYKIEHPNHYYPDGYIYTALCWVVISSGIVLFAERLLTEFFSENSNLYGVFGYAFLLIVVIVPVYLILRQACYRIGAFDPASKIFKSPDEDIVQKHEVIDENDAEFIRLWKTFTDDEKSAAIAFMRAFKK